MHDMIVHVLRPGEYVAIDAASTLTFYQVQVDGTIVPSSAFASDEQVSMLDTEGNPVTRETPLEKLNPPLTVRTFNVLKREGLNTVGDVLDLHAKDRGAFYEMRNMGGKGNDEISACIYEWRKAGT